MSIEGYLSIDCDRCHSDNLLAEWPQWGEPLADAFKVARVSAHNEGWRYDPESDTDACPKCVVAEGLG